MHHLDELSARRASQPYTVAGHGIESASEWREGHYQQAMRRVLGADFIYCHVHEEDSCLIVKIRGGLLRDYGDVLAAESGTDKEITSLIKLLPLKGWTSVEAFGTPAFRQRFQKELVASGFTPSLPQTHKRHLEDEDAEVRSVEGFVRELLAG